MIGLSISDLLRAENSRRGCSGVSNLTQKWEKIIHAEIELTGFGSVEKDLRITTNENSKTGLFLLERLAEPLDCLLEPTSIDSLPPAGKSVGSAQHGPLKSSSDRSSMTCFEAPSRDTE